jgi:hypothetical protein
VDQLAEQPVHDVAQELLPCLLAQELFQVGADVEPPAREVVVDVARDAQSRAPRILRAEELGGVC